LDLGGGSRLKLAASKMIEAFDAVSHVKAADMLKAAEYI
jgi:hypothetical protein